MYTPRRLVSGAPRLLARHDGVEGHAYRRAYLALDAQFGPFRTELLRNEGGRTALAWLQFKLAVRALGEAQRARRVGKGRRPNAQAIERLARRVGLCDRTYAQALDKLRSFVTVDAGDPGAQHVAQLRGGRGA